MELKKEANEIIALDKRYGKIICVCNNISEGEIVDALDATSDEDKPALTTEDGLTKWLEEHIYLTK